MNELNVYLINALETLLSAVSRTLNDGSCCKQDLAFLRMSLYEFQSNIEADYRFNAVIKHRVALLDLRYFDLDEMTVGEKISGFFSSAETKRLAQERKAVRFILRDFKERLYSLKVLASHYDVSCSMDRMTARYLTFAPL